MFCQSCGSEIAEGTNFCPKCGATQNNGQVVQAQTNVDERAVLMQNIINSSEVINAIATAENKASESKKKLDEYTQASGNNSFIILGVLMVVFLLGGMFWGGLMVLSPFWLGAIVFKIVNTKKKNKFAKIYNEDIDTLERLMNDASLSWLPYDYRDSFSMGHIITYLKNMRARNIQEAINLLETEMHQARMEYLSANAAIVVKNA